MWLQKDFSPILNLKTAYSSRKFHYLDETASLVAPHSPSFMPNYSGTMIPPLPALQFSSTNAQYEFLEYPVQFSLLILLILRHLHFYELYSRLTLFNEIWKSGNRSVKPKPVLKVIFDVCTLNDMCVIH